MKLAPIILGSICGLAVAAPVLPHSSYVQGSTDMADQVAGNQSFKFKYVLEGRDLQGTSDSAKIVESRDDHPKQCHHFSATAGNTLGPCPDQDQKPPNLEDELQPEWCGTVRCPGKPWWRVGKGKEGHNKDD